MDVKVTDHAQWEKNIEVKVTYEELTPKFDEAYKKYKKSIQLEGFRKGKVPLGLIKKVFGAQIENEVAEDSISEYLQEAINQNKIRFHDLVKIDKFEYNREDGLSFSAIIRVEPDIELTQYKGLEVEKKVYKITDDDLNDALENLREQHATMSNVEGEAQEGHFIVADLQKTDETGHPLIGERYENQYLRLEPSSLEEGIISQLVGIKSGEKRQISIATPQEAGETPQDAYYSVTVKEIKEKKLPELDDEFAKDIGNYENLDLLKEDLQRRLEDQVKSSDEQQFKNTLMDAVVKANPIDLPEFMIESYLNALIKNVRNNNKQEIDEEEIREKYRADAVWNLKWMLIRDKIAELENIKVDDKEIDEYVEKLAQDAGENAPQIRKRYRDQRNREKLVFDLIEDKIVNFVAEHARINEKEVTYQDLKKMQEISESIVD